MRRARFLLVLTTLPLVLGAETPSDEPAVPVVRLAAQPAGPAPRALRYALVPEHGDLQPGNAALLWLRAGLASREAKPKLKDEWAGPEGTALKDLPRDEVRQVLDAYVAALRVAEQAALRDRCDWQTPPFRLNAWDFSFAELSDFRLLANLLSVRCRLELSEGDFDKAAATLRTGLTLARHLGESDTMIQNLVGIAVAAVLLGRVEEWQQLPGAPNLYWSLSALPSPPVDVRRAMENELGNLYGVLPQLKRLRADPLEPLQGEVLLADLTDVFRSFEDRNASEWQVRLMLAALTAKVYPDARRSLLAAGHKAERLDALPAAQVVMAHYVDQYDRQRDEARKWLSLPPWQARAGIERMEREMPRGGLDQGGNPFIMLLFPAVVKVYDARVRLERTVATLRCGEALRAYAAAHDGRAPDRLADVGLPLPVDPFTGKGYDAWYRVAEGRGILEVPAPAPLPRHYGRVIEVGK